MTDTITQAQRAHGNNWLKNGNFDRIPTDLVAKSYPDPTPTLTPRITLVDRITRSDVSVSIGTTAQQRFLANWSVYGSTNNVGSVDTDPLDKRSGIRLRSFDSGRLVRVSFFQDGIITLEQEIEVTSQFRGMPATFAYSACRISGEVKIQAQVDFGTEVKMGLPYFSSSLGSYRRIIASWEACPVNFTKILVKIVVTGRRGDAVGISGCAFALGEFPLDLPYSDAMGDVLLPRGTIILWAGASCPPGFRDVPGADGGFLYQTYGDPNSMSGATEEYPTIPPADPFLNQYATRRPEPRTSLGNNEHFAHQTTNLFGEPIDEWESAPADIIRRLATTDFNDLGEPPGGRPNSPNPPIYDRAPSVEATMAKGAGYPIQDPESQDQIERFKLSSEQNEVLPGGVGKPLSIHAADSDIWRDPHRHMFKSNGTPTLPPFFGVRFCEKI